MELETIIQVEEKDIGQRVDVFLASVLPEISRARIQALLSEGHILSQHGKLKSSHRLTTGDILTVNLPEPRVTEIRAEALTLEIIYEDKDLVVLNKPAGMVVHPGAGHYEGTLVNALLHRYPDMHVGDAQRPGLVHRLDKDTSGVMVCARHDASYLALASQFKSREVTKTYRAFCLGKPKKQSFELITGHARHRTDRKRFTTKVAPPEKVGTGVRLAHSKFELLLSAGGVSELKVELLTGRTHQIRAHLADINYPLVQDRLYGGQGRIKQLPETPVREAVLALERHGLHAEILAFTHPTTRKKLSFEVPLPADLQALHDAMTTINADG